MRHPLLSLVLLLLSVTTARAEWSAEVERGVAWLTARQRDEGAFAEGRSALPATAIVTLALMSAGHEPDLGRHGLALRRAVDFLQREVPRAADRRGDVDARDRALLLLSLLEAASIEPDAARRQRQVEPLVALAQTLEECRDEEAREWIDLARAAAARFGLVEAARRSTPATRPDDPGRTGPTLDEGFFAARRLLTAGTDDSRDRLASLLRDIAQRQERDGSWSRGGAKDDAGDVVTTAVAVLTLSLPSRHLPSLAP